MDSARSGKKEALQAALRFLSIRPRSVSELTGKLRQKGFEASDIDEAIGFLIDSGYLDDEKFARMLAESRIRNKSWGPRKIRFELASKGISEEIIKKALAGSTDETATALDAFRKWRRKNLKLDLSEPKNIDKAYRHLQGRGFSLPAAMEVFKKFKSAVEDGLE